MPLYEYKKNAENRIRLPKGMEKNIFCGSKEVLKSIVDKITGVKNGLVLFDGWYGINWDKIITQLKSELPDALFFNAAGLFKPIEIIEKYRRPFVTDDPSFGWVNDKDIMEDLMDEEKIASFKQSVSKEERINILYGTGSAIKSLVSDAKLVYYFDFTMQPLLWQIWDGKLVPFGCNKVDKDYRWKEYLST
ncbi:hypothetical protein ES705_39807 [subsurface metagenome]